VTNQPTKTWVNPRPGSTPEWLRPTLQSLEAFLARPHFYNGIRLGDGTAPSQDQEGTTTLPDTTRWDSDAVTTIEDALAGLGTDLTSVYATLASMEADIIALETDPIDGTRITDDSIDTPQLKANSVTATNLAALNIGVSKWIASTSYTAGVDGWIIAADGTAEFNDVLVRGTLETGTTGGRTVVGPLAFASGYYGVKLFSGDELSDDDCGFVAVGSDDVGSGNQGFIFVQPPAVDGVATTAPDQPSLWLTSRSFSGGGLSAVDAWADYFRVQADNIYLDGDDTFFTGNNAHFNVDQVWIGSTGSGIEGKLNVVNDDQTSFADMAIIASNNSTSGVRPAGFGFYSNGTTARLYLDQSVGSNLLLNGNGLVTAAHMKGGATTATTDGSGEVVVTHNLGACESVVVTVDAASPFAGAALHPVISARTSTTFTVRWFNGGALYTGGSVVFQWVVANNA
jgi:hypothetical protein